MFTFILCAAADCLFLGYDRIKYFLLAASVCVSCYYTYKETLVEAKKYLTLGVYKRLSIAQVIQACLFAVLMRFYFIA